MDDHVTQLCYTWWVADTFSIRTDPELEAALAYLGVTETARNRSAIIREAVLTMAAAQRDIAEAGHLPEPTFTRVPGTAADGTTSYILSIPALGDPR